MKKLLILLILAILLINVNAQEFPNYYDKYINDFAHLFNNQETEDLRSTLYVLDQNTTVEVVVVTINSTIPLTPAEYKTKLFNLWHIGKKNKDNGLLILYSLKENRIEVETGYGLEGILPDSKLGRMLDEFYVPYRDKKQVAQGIILFTKEIAKVIQENELEVYSGKNKGSILFDIFFSLFPLIFFIIFILSIHRIINTGKRKCKKDHLEMKLLGVVAGYYIYKCAKGHEEKISKTFANSYLGGRYSGGFSGGGFSGGSFGGFGGGMSGGGGAGR